MPTYSFVLNGEQVSVDAPGDIGLLYIIRDLLGLTGPKYGCGVGVCRACTSHLNGEEFQPCVTPVSMVEGQDVTTIEGLADGDTLHPVQEAWIDLDVAQCGYCQPGQIMAAAALLQKKRNPTDADIDAIENICRCGTYFRIRSAIKQAAQNGAGRGRRPTAAAAAAVAGDQATTDAASNGRADAAANGKPAAAAAPERQPATADSHAAEVTRKAEGVLAAADVGGTRTLPATGAGAGAAGLIAAAAAAIRRHKDPDDELDGIEPAAEG